MRRFVTACSTHSERNGRPCARPTKHRRRKWISCEMRITANRQLFKSYLDQAWRPIRYAAARTTDTGRGRGPCRRGCGGRHPSPPRRPPTVTGRSGRGVGIAIRSDTTRIVAGRAPSDLAEPRRLFAGRRVLCAVPRWATNWLYAACRTPPLCEKFLLPVRSPTAAHGPSSAPAVFLVAKGAAADGSDHAVCVLELGARHGRSPLCSSGGSRFAF